jgi:hypothetical protein
MADRLPIELIHEILLSNTPPRILCALPNQGNSNQTYTPLLVSKTWYSAALTCSRLWVHVDLTNWHKENLPSSALELWLDRSGNQGLRIKLDDQLAHGTLLHLRNQPAGPVGKESDYSELWDSLLKHVVRWKSLSFSGTVRELGSLMSIIFSATALEELSIKIFVEGISISRLGPELGHLPLLARLSLAHIIPEYLPPLGNANTKYLRLSALWMDLYQLQECAANLPNLQELELHDMSFRTYPPSNSATQGNLFLDLQTLTTDFRTAQGSSEAIAHIIQSTAVMHTMVFKTSLTVGEGLRFFDKKVAWWCKYMAKFPASLLEVKVVVEVIGGDDGQEVEIMDENTARIGFGQAELVAKEATGNVPKRWRMVQTTKHGRRVQFLF